MGCASSWPHIFTSCRFQSLLLCLPETLSNQCTINTASTRIEWVFSQLHYLQSSFHHPLFYGTCHFWSFLSYYYFLQPIHHDCCLDDLCKLHQIYLPYFAWVTNTSLGNLWKSYPLIYWLSSIQDCSFPQHNSCWYHFLYCWYRYGFCYLLLLELLQGNKLFPL